MKFKNKSAFFILISFVLVLCAYGVMAITAQKKIGIKMNHKLHIQTFSLDCETCHSASKNGKLMTMPDHEVCQSCHSMESENDCKMCHTTKAPFSGLRKEQIFKDTFFSHATHAAKKIDCLACHENVSILKTITANEALPQMGECIACHETRKVVNGSNCTFCHSEDITSSKPVSHSPLWLITHGRNKNFTQVKKECELCHTSQIAGTCSDCHMREAPKNHNLSFRLNGHARSATVDRESCSICHNESSCIECHATTAPFSHSAMYGTPFNRHCNNCHMESANWGTMSGTRNNCTFCHTMAGANQKHLNVPPMPGVNHIQTDCLYCHQFGGGKNIPPMKHPKTGPNATCIECHK